MADIPKIISVDDHVLEPPHLWSERLPAKYRERGPRVVRDSVGIDLSSGIATFVKGGDGPMTDWWVYEDVSWACPLANASAGIPREQHSPAPIAYADMRPGIYQTRARLEDMDRNHVERALCFPSFPRFCGQTFLAARDKALALLCIQAFNDWVIEEWCGTSGGRLIPLCLIPLWSPELAAAEVRRSGVS